MSAFTRDQEDSMANITNFADACLPTDPHRTTNSMLLKLVITHVTTFGALGYLLSLRNELRF